MLNKSKFRVEGLPTMVFKDKKEAVQMWNEGRKNQGRGRTCGGEYGLVTLEYGEGVVLGSKRGEKIKRSATDENFVVEPWDEVEESYY